jgi:heparan-alpha-glucosaminide N-acetyltransferase
MTATVAETREVGSPPAAPRDDATVAFASARPPPPPSASPLSGPTRVASIDVVRGIVIFTMIVVNDIAGVSGVPAWFKHIQPPNADGMTFVDVVFPAFLFVVGMSIPFALGGRLARGEPWWRVLAHVLARTIGLLIIGVLMVNMDDAADDGSGFSPTLWQGLVYTAVIVTWLAPPVATRRGRVVTIVVRCVGAAALVWLASQYQGRNGAWLRTQWWGILGLIGWAYLVASLVYLAVRERSPHLVAALALLIGVCICDKEGGFAWLPLGRYVDVGGALGSLAATSVAGVLLATIIRDDAPSLGRRLVYAIGSGAALAAGAMLLDPLYGINKIAATPSWVLWSAAIMCWLWAAVAWVVDVHGWTRWSVPFRIGGEAPLMAYILHPLLYTVLILAGLNGTLLGWGDNGFGPGLTRAILIAMLVTVGAGLLGRAGLRLRL